jgi:hypothetical protein
MRTGSRQTFRLSRGGAALELVFLISSDPECDMAKRTEFAIESGRANEVTAKLTERAAQDYKVIAYTVDGGTHHVLLSKRVRVDSDEKKPAAVPLNPPVW